MPRDAELVYNFVDSNYGIMYRREIVETLGLSDERYKEAIRYLIKRKLARRRLKRKGGGIVLLR